MAQSDNHPDPKTRKGQKHRQELAPHMSNEHSGKNSGKSLAAQNTDTHPFPPCSTWLSDEKLVMHCTVDDHKPTLLPASQEKAGSPSSTHRARSDSCIRQCGPSTTARMCLQHQLTGRNPSLALQLYAEQTSKSSFSVTRI